MCIAVACCSIFIFVQYACLVFFPIHAREMVACEATVSRHNMSLVSSEAKGSSHPTTECACITSDKQITFARLISATGFANVSTL